MTTRAKKKDNNETQDARQHVNDFKLTLGRGLCGKGNKEKGESGEG